MRCWQTGQTWTLTSEEYLTTEIKISRSARNNPRLVLEDSRPIVFYHQALGYKWVNHRNNGIGTLNLHLEFILEKLYIYLINDFKDIHRYKLARVSALSSIPDC